MPSLPNAQSGDRPAGFKIGATSRRAQGFLDCDGPFAGTVLAGDLFESPATLPAGRFTFRLIEPEFAVTLGRDLPPRQVAYGMEDVDGAVASLHPAIEVVTSVLENWAGQGVPSLIADNGVNGALVLGPACRDWQDFDLASHEVTLSVNGAPAGSGRGANALGRRSPGSPTSGRAAGGAWRPDRW
jgi:2-keto-4-pentenoate hydratase